MGLISSINMRIDSLNARSHYQTKTATGKEKLYMYSCSKVITAVCVMMLIERGKLKLEDKVEKLEDKFKDKFELQNEDDFQLNRLLHFLLMYQ